MRMKQRNRIREREKEKQKNKQKNFKWIYELQSVEKQNDILMICVRIQCIEHEQVTQKQKKKKHTQLKGELRNTIAILACLQPIQVFRLDIMLNFDFGCKMYSNTYTRTPNQPHTHKKYIPTQLY